MKKFISIFITIALFACTKTDPSHVDALPPGYDLKIADSLCRIMNVHAAALKDIIVAETDGVKVVSVESSTTDTGTAYTVFLADNKEVVLNTKKNPGPGPIPHPVLNVMKENETWYWILNSSPMLDIYGNRVPVTDSPCPALQAGNMGYRLSIGPQSIAVNPARTGARPDPFVYIDSSDPDVVTIRLEGNLKIILDKENPKTSDIPYRLAKNSTEGTIPLNVVLIGDAYTKTLIDDGTYDSDMELAMENLFSVEPMTSLKNRFRYYVMYAESDSTAPNGTSSTVFRTAIDNYGSLTAYPEKALLYALKIPEVRKEVTFADYAIRVEEDSLRQFTDVKGGLLVIVVVNTKHAFQAGRTYMWDNQSAVAFCPVQDRDKVFRYTVRHEAVGHGFGYLADEYQNIDSGPITENSKLRLQYSKEDGFYANVTTDPKGSEWSHLMNDARYAPEIKICEGAFLYDYGVYRPSQQSIMRMDVDYFNAPSREALFRRAMRLSEPDYIYQFEDFARFDREYREELQKTPEL